MSLAQTLSRVFPDLPPSLISAQAASDLLAVARLLPADLPHLGLECRLGEADSRADLLVLLNRETRGPSWLAQQEHWPHCRDFGRGWADPTCSLHQSADHVWLEFDLAVGQCKHPSLFLSPLAGNRAVLAEAAQRLGCLLPSILPACLQALPDSACLFQAGWMVSRKPAPMRLCLCHMEWMQLQEYLKAVGWAGKLSLLEPAWEKWQGLSQSMMINLDLWGDRVGPKLGLELYPRSGLLAQLVADQLCRPEKGEALAQFPGHGLVSEFLNKATAVVRRIHHYKLSLEGDAWDAKAYLSLTPRLVSI